MKSNSLLHLNYKFKLPSYYKYINYVSKGRSGFIYKLLDIRDNKYYIIKLHNYIFNKKIDKKSKITYEEYIHKLEEEYKKSNIMNNLMSRIRAKRLQKKTTITLKEENKTSSNSSGK